MKWRDDVWVGNITPRANIILMAIQSAEYELEHEATISGVGEGAHGAKSKHWVGDAVDCFCDPWNDVTRLIFAEEIRKHLPTGYDVLVEDSHVHIEWDPKVKRVTVEFTR